MSRESIGPEQHAQLLPGQLGAPKADVAVHVDMASPGLSRARGGWSVLLRQGPSDQVPLVAAADPCVAATLGVALPRHGFELQQFALASFQKAAYCLDMGKTIASVIFAVTPCYLKLAYAALEVLTWLLSKLHVLQRVRLCLSVPTYCHPP